MSPRPDDGRATREWVRLAPASALPPGKAVRVDIDGEQQIALFRTESGYYALSDMCPHMGGPLSEGEIVGGAVTCPWHGWRYDAATGTRVDRTGQAAMTYPVEVRDGYLFLDLGRTADR